MKDHLCNIYFWTDVRIITGSPSVTMTTGTRSFIFKQCGHKSDVSLIYHLPIAILALPVAITSQGLNPIPTHPNPIQEFLDLVPPSPESQFFQGKGMPLFHPPPIPPDFSPYGCPASNIWLFTNSLKKLEALYSFHSLHSYLCLHIRKQSFIHMNKRHLSKTSLAISSCTEDKLFIL